MLILSLIILLLSNSITLRRDKSILYSRATITILVIATLISYDNLNFLFLNKGIGIFSGLFHATATTSVFQIFILFITSAILLLTSFCTRKSLFYTDFSWTMILLFSSLLSLVIGIFSGLFHATLTTSVLYWYKSYYIHISLLFMSVRFLFKVFYAPFHFLSPYVYDAIPTIVTTFVAIIAKIFYLFILFIYSMYMHINIIVLTYKGLCFFVLFGLLTDDPLLYYQYLWLLYSVAMTNNYIKNNNKFLCNYPAIKSFIILILDYLQGLLLGILLNIISNTLISFLKSMFGHILKMEKPENSDLYNPNNKNPNRNDNNGKGPDNNGKGPDNKSKVFKSEASDSDEDESEVNYITKKGALLDEGVVITYDKQNRLKSKVYWKEIVVDNKLRKQITKTEFYNKSGILYEAVISKDGDEVATYKYNKKNNS